MALQDIQDNCGTGAADETLALLVRAIEFADRDPVLAVLDVGMPASGISMT